LDGQLGQAYLGKTMPLNTEIDRYAETGYCLIRGTADAVCGIRTWGYDHAAAM
jgi:hypothetical protein